MAFASTPGAATDNVDAPERTSTEGQSTSGFGPAAAFGSPGLAGDPKNKAFIRWLNDDPPEELAGGGEDGGEELNVPSIEEHADAASPTARATASAEPPGRPARPRCRLHRMIKARFPYGAL